MVDIAEAFVTLRPDTKGFAQAAKSGITGAFGAIGVAAAAGMAVVGGAIAATAVSGVQAFAGFQRQMNEVFTLLPGITGEAMDAMSAQALQLAKDMGTLPEEVVPALYQALSAGVPQDNVFAFLETANKAAIAGVTDLETSVNAITGVVNAYGADAISAIEASDLMFTTVRLGKTTFDELAASLANVLPFASAAGVDFANISAAMSTLTAVTGQTSESTTKLRQLIVELSDSAKGVGDDFGTLTGKNFKEFIAAGGTLQEALQALTKHAEGVGISVDQMFGSVEAGAAALILTGAASDSFTAALEEMGTSAGATEAAYATMDQGMSRAMDKIRAGWEVLKVHIGESLMPAVQAFADWLLENMPTIEEKITTFFTGVALVAEAIAQSFFGMETDITGALSGVDASMETSKTASQEYAGGVAANNATALSSFQTVATFIQEDFVPALQSIRDWWDDNLEPMLESYRQVDEAFRRFMEGYSNVVDTARGVVHGSSWLNPLSLIPSGLRGLFELAEQGHPEHHAGGIFGEGGRTRNLLTQPPRSNEGLAILERGEEILTRDDPRHARFGGQAVAVAAGDGGLTVENLTINNPAPEPAGVAVRDSLMAASFLLGRG